MTRGLDGRRQVEIDKKEKKMCHLLWGGGRKHVE